MTAIEDLAKEVAATARALAGGPSGQFCARIVPVQIDVEGVGSQSYAIVIDTARSTVIGQSARIDDDLLESDALHVKFRDLIRLELEPFVEGIGQFQVLWGESFDGIVVIAYEPDDKFGERHDSVPLKSSAASGKT